MDKINFQNGTLVTPAKVNIEGTQYNVTEAEYSGSTPLSAHVLNQLQTNIENAIQEVADTAITETATTTQDGLMSKEDKAKLDTLKNTKIIQKDGEATTENVYSAETVKEITEGLDDRITSLEERSYLKNISVHVNDNKFDDVSQIINDLKDYEAYCITNHPVEDGNYVQNGASHTVLGMQYADLKYGSQLSFGLNGIKFRTQNNGVWSAWQTK